MWVWIVVVLIVIVVAVAFYYFSSDVPFDVSQKEGGEEITAEAGQPMFNENLSEEAMNKEATKAVEITGGPEGSAKNPVLTYEIKAEGGKFIPAETVIEKGRRVQIGVIAVDADYDISFAAPLGTYLQIKKGQAAVFGFDAGEEKIGEYVFVCKDFCPKSGTMAGKLIVR